MILLNFRWIIGLFVLLASLLMGVTYNYVSSQVSTSSISINESIAESLYSQALNSSLVPETSQPANNSSEASLQVDNGNMTLKEIMEIDTPLYSVSYADPESGESGSYEDGEYVEVETLFDEVTAQMVCNGTSGEPDLWHMECVPILKGLRGEIAWKNLTPVAKTTADLVLVIQMLDNACLHVLPPKTLSLVDTTMEGIVRTYYRDYPKYMRTLLHRQNNACSRANNLFVPGHLFAVPASKDGQVSISPEKLEVLDSEITRIKRKVSGMIRMLDDLIPRLSYLSRNNVAFMCVSIEAINKRIEAFRNSPLAYPRSNIALVSKIARGIRKFAKSHSEYISKMLEFSNRLLAEGKKFHRMPKIHPTPGSGDPEEKVDFTTELFLDHIRYVTDSIIESSNWANVTSNECE